LLQLVEKKLISLDFASVLAVCIGTWMTGHAIDGNFWVVRNMAIIDNIERQFLVANDKKNIFFYISDPRTWGVEAFFRIQIAFSLVVMLLMLAHHGFSWFHAPILSNSPVLFTVAKFPLTEMLVKRSCPYVFCAISFIILITLYCYRKSEFENFIKQSPGYPLSPSKTPENK